MTHLLEQKLETSRGSSRDPNLSLKRPRVRQDRTIFRRVALLDFLLTRASMICRDILGFSNMMLSAPLLLETPWAWLNVTTSPSKNTGLLKKLTPVPPVPRPTSNLSGMKYSQLLLWFLVNKPQICSGDLGRAVKLRRL